MKDGQKVKFFRAVLGNIIICATVASLLFVTVTANGGGVDAQSAEPYYSGESDSKLSLMVNVYWGTEYIRPMLETLERHGAKTTFFVGGSWAAQHPDTLKAIYTSGHEIGNHGYYHKDHSQLDLAYNKKEISAAHETVRDIVGCNMTLFAPPSGAYGSATVAAASELGYRTVLWTRDTIDWRDHDSRLIASRATKNMKGGDLVLMHPTEATAKALDGILTAVEAAGLAVAPVSEVLKAAQ